MPLRVLRGLLLLGTIAAAVVGSAVLAGISTIGGGRHGNPVTFWAYSLVGAGLVNLGAYLVALHILAPPGTPWRRLVPGTLIGGIGLDRPRGRRRPPGQPRAAPRHAALRVLRHRARTGLLAVARLAAVHVRRGDQRRAGPAAVAPSPRRPPTRDSAGPGGAGGPGGPGGPGVTRDGSSAAQAPANSLNAASARGPQTVPGPPFMEMATPIVSATSSVVAPRRARAPGVRGDAPVTLPGDGDGQGDQLLGLHVESAPSAKAASCSEP